MASDRDYDLILALASEGHLIDAADAMRLAACEDLTRLADVSQQMCISAHGHHLSFSKKVFIPLTKLCRDVCSYCTFAERPSTGRPAYLSPDEVLAIASRGVEQGCKEALFTLGDKPELRYAAAREWLARHGYATTLDYLEAMAALVLKETGLLPHINAGVMGEADLRRFKNVSASQGLMLETASERLSERGGAHYGSPDKLPSYRLATIAAAGRARVPFTTGILIGIGETKVERIDTLLAIRALDAQFSHIQEVIIQNFRAKPGTRMAAAPEPSLEDQLWTIAMARIILGAKANLQTPPNLRPHDLARLATSGINDWGGVSPVTPDHVNPEAPWPHLDELASACEAAGRTLVERLTIYPIFSGVPKTWLADNVRVPVLRLADAAGLAREDAWIAGSHAGLPAPLVDRLRNRRATPSPMVQRILASLDEEQTPGEADICNLFDARGPDFSAICAAADRLRATRNGDVVSFVINRNINYTNVCTYGCKFCAFSKGRHNLGHRDKPYNLELAEIAERTREAAERGATEVCLQGGIKPDYTGKTYIAIVEAVKAAVPDIHVHAFSPLEIWNGATTLGLPLHTYLQRLKMAGLSSLPGTAAEILDDEVRAVLCPDKITTAQWLEVMSVAHEIGLKSTATIMFGHVDRYVHWARHLLRVRALQKRTGGFTEFVPLPFVHMEAPIYLKGQARKGPTFREAILMHAVARLVLDPLITNIQASWVKMGPEGAAHCLDVGANDLGGVLMNESITRAAGAVHGQELTAADLIALITKSGRSPRQRKTNYEPVDCNARPPTKTEYAANSAIAPAQQAIDRPLVLSSFPA